MMRTFIFSLAICLVLCYITLNHILQLASFTALDFQQDFWIILRHWHIFLSGFSVWQCKIPYLRWLILIIWFHRSNSLFMQEPLENNSGCLKIFYGNAGTFSILWFTTTDYFLIRSMKYHNCDKWRPKGNLHCNCSFSVCNQVLTIPCISEFL